MVSTCRYILVGEEVRTESHVCCLYIALDRERTSSAERVYPPGVIDHRIINQILENDMRNGLRTKAFGLPDRRYDEIGLFVSWSFPCQSHFPVVPLMFEKAN
jgi:hypothetical protein